MIAFVLSGAGNRPIFPQNLMLFVMLTQIHLETLSQSLYPWHKKENGRKVQEVTPSSLDRETMNQKLRKDGHSTRQEIGVRGRINEIDGARGMKVVHQDMEDLGL